MLKYTLNNGERCIQKDGCCHHATKKMNVFDWLSDLPETQKETNFIEVQFKNTRRGYFLNDTNISLKMGDMVTVESPPGRDVGEVTLTGKLVLLQMKKYNIDLNQFEAKRVYRKAKEIDLQKYKEAKSKEQSTMIRARQISEDLKLDMKIGDVEYQGDGTKAIFYYIAEGRVDFRQLIKVLAETFRVRIEMKQIGARQEAGRIGGIGPCGRALCCASWLSHFNSVTTSAARYQDIALNPQKLAGQCTKLKCCMKYELETYLDALKQFPAKEVQIETLENTYYHFKTDVFKGTISYSTSPHFGANVVTILPQRAKELIAMNKKGIKPSVLEDNVLAETKPNLDQYNNELEEDSLTRFDTNKKKRSMFLKKSNKKISLNNTPKFEKPKLRNNNDTQKSGN